MEKNENQALKMKHAWRDGVFRYLFKDAKNFVQIYETFSGRRLLPEDVEFKDTDSIVMSKDLKNDVSFVDKSGNFIVLIEHQHTKCPNMGLRMLIYYGELLKMYIKKHELNIYGTVPIPYPKAIFYVAYTGQKDWDEDVTIEAGDVHINVKMVNINYEKLAIKSPDNTLSGYAYLLQQFEFYRGQNILPIYAVDKAFEDCREKGYLMDYINREEFMAMVTKRWTVEQQMIDREQWARDAGVEIGRLEERAKAELEKQELQTETIKRFLDLGLSHADVARGAGVDISLVEEVAQEKKDA
jgi:hypothetical protein